MTHEENPGKKYGPEPEYRPLFILTDENGEPPSYSRKAIKQIVEQYVPVESIRFPRGEFYNVKGAKQLEELLEEHAADGRVRITPIIEMEINTLESGYVTKAIRAYLGVEVPYRDARGNKRTAVGMSINAPQKASANIHIEYETIGEVITQILREIDQLKQITGAETVLPRLTLYDVSDKRDILRGIDMSEYVRKVIQATQKTG